LLKNRSFNMTIFRFAVSAALGLCAVSASVANAQAWPNKPIRFVNPFPAGGGTDTFARPLAAVLTKQLGQSVVIENLGGAGGTVGAAVAAKAAPDGYTFMVGAIHHTIAPSVYQKLTYDIEKDFVPITVIAKVPNVVISQPKAGFNTFKDLLAYAKSNPGKLTFATPGAGTAQQLAAELVKVNQSVDLLHVPYKGMGPAMQDFLGGTVDVIFDGMGASAAQVRGGKAKALGLMAAKRSAQFPDIPTLAEQGYPGLEVTTWYALWALKGTPQDIVDKMHAEVMKAANDEIVKNAWNNASAELPSMSRAEFGGFVRSEMDRWGKVAKAAGVKVDN
jgi:tripartite-type tricarboxylate transporter receptor subunit TctC